MSIKINAVVFLKLSITISP